jgi:hypothetical protein
MMFYENAFVANAFALMLFRAVLNLLEEITT